MTGRKHDDSVGPSAKHWFVAPSDPRSALAVAGVQPALQQAPALAVTAASVRQGRCALKGCGKTREDEIHEAE